MSYILEHKNEFERLEKQNRDPEFDPLYDLKQFDLGKPGVILDAGCGSGALTYVMERLYPEAKIIGVDGSEARVQQLKEARPVSSRLEFIHADLRRLPFENSYFDVMVVRYVFQHMSPSVLSEALKELHRCLKPGGKLLVVDVDGYFESVYPTGPYIQKVVDSLRSGGILDLNVGRKLPHLLNLAGFSQVNWDLQVVSFNHESRARELTRAAERLDCSKEAILKAGMSADEFQQLRKEFLGILAMEYSVCYLNRFYITASNPTLSLVKI